MSKKFVPSPFQQAYFDWIQKGTGSAIMKAVAGSGKSTTIVEGMKYISEEEAVLFLAFNKSIAEELTARVPERVTCKTMNALGHGAVMKKFGRVKLDANKTSLILDSMMKDKLITYEEIREHGLAIKRLVAIAKQVGLVPEIFEDKVTLVEDTRDNWDDLIEHYDVDFGSDEERAEMLKSMCIEWASTALARSISTTHVIDFNDQLYLPVVYGLALNKYDWVVVDEAQDISAIQRCLISKALKPKTGRLVAVGDPCQAIYGFRGADSQSLNNIATTFNCIELPLTISYRCPKAVIREAQQYVSHITSADSAKEGSVTDLGMAKPEMFKAGDLAICRNTAPIIQLAYSLISKRIPAKVLGREIGEGLVTLIRKLKARSIPALEDKLSAWKDKECERLRLKDKDADLSKVEDKYDCIKCFLEFAAPSSVEDLIRSIQSMFGDSSANAVTLSTIHKAKGLEAKRVFIIDKWRMPSKWAKKPHQMEQEVNLIYVAITRAQEELIYVEMPKKKED